MPRSSRQRSSDEREASADKLLRSEGSALGRSSLLRGEGGSLLVWARPGPYADAQAVWTACIARGLKQDVTLLDLVRRRAIGAHTEEEIQTEISGRLERLQERSDMAFEKIPTGLRVSVSRDHGASLASASSERRSALVLWAPIRESLVRTLCQAAPRPVLVVRSARVRPDLPWTACVPEGDALGRSVAEALVRGSGEKSSVRVVTPEEIGASDAHRCRVACLSRPIPGWWRSRVLRRKRTAPARRSAVIEVYDGTGEPH